MHLKFLTITRFVNFFLCDIIQGYKEITGIITPYRDDGILLKLAMLNFNNFMISLSNLHPQIYYTYKKTKITRDEKVNLVQILNFVGVNVMLNSKNSISTDAYYKGRNKHA